MNKEIMNEEVAETPRPVINNLSLNKLMRIQDIDRDELNISDFSFEEDDCIFHENPNELPVIYQSDSF